MSIEKKLKLIATAFLVACFGRVYAHLHLPQDAIITNVFIVVSELNIWVGAVALPILYVVDTALLFRRSVENRVNKYGSEL